MNSRPGPAPETPTDAAVVQAAAGIRAAGRARRGIDRAVLFGRVSAWTLAVFAGLSGLSSLASLAAGGFDPAGLLLAAALATAAALEFRGVARLVRLEPAGAAALARNQLFIGAVVLAWCAYRALGAAAGQDAYGEAIAQMPELEATLGDLGGMVRTAAIVACATAGATAAGLQALAWRFHRRRVGMTEAYLRDTPAWARGG